MKAFALTTLTALLGVAVHLALGPSAVRAQEVAATTGTRGGAQARHSEAHRV